MARDGNIFKKNKEIVVLFEQKKSSGCLGKFNIISLIYESLAGEVNKK